MNAAPAASATLLHVPAGELTLRSHGDVDDVTRAARGDMAAFERVYLRHHGRVHALAGRMLGSDEADDATQEIFFRAWKKLGSYRGEAAFSTWLHRLAMNLLIRRAAGVRRIVTTTMALEGDVGAATDPSIDARLDVDRALAALAPGLRAAVILHDIEGYSHEEVGELLDISMTAARMRLYRARIALRAFAADGP
jgi:RNA polymerase sigma-70 factor (ECF subfamily)